MDRVATLVSAALTASTLFANLVSASGQNGTIPMQLRLAYAGSTGMVVSWNTYSQLSHPTVRYGRDPEHLNRVASSDVSVTYPTSTTYNNHVSIAHLEPNTLYYYQPYDSNSSVPYTFKTSRHAGDKTPYSIAVAVDMGLMGPRGLTTTVGAGTGHPLGPHDNNTMQSLQAQGADTDFLWHRKFFLSELCDGIRLLTWFPYSG
jgi:hypothetical protein